MTSGTTGSMSGTGQGPYLADMIAQWLGWGGDGAAQAPAGQSQALFPASLGYGGAPPKPAQPVPRAPGVRGIGPLGPNASMYDDAGAYGGTPDTSPLPIGGFGPSAYRSPGQGRGGIRTTELPAPGALNRPRVGASPAGVPGVGVGVPGARPSPMATSPDRYGGAGSAQSLLAAILGTGGVY